MVYWQFRPLNPNDNSGISTVDDNFADEERTTVEILVRETLQNPLDARKDENLVEVRYNLVSLDRGNSVFLDALLSDNCLLHFGYGKLIKPDTLPKKIDFLVIEDFGTTGLEGCYTDSSVDGESENWNAFWFREGEGAKPTRSNGGAGQGKITLYSASAMRSVMALTHRSSDGKELLFGCCRFKQNYKIPNQNERWAKEARWGATLAPDALSLPIEDSNLIEAIKLELGLQRKNRPGTSFIVPMPVGMSLPDLKKAVVNEFFFPIRRGRLKVYINDIALDKTSIATAANELATDSRYPRDYRNFLEQSIVGHIDAQPIATAKTNWAQSNKLSANNFDSTQYSLLKVAFEKSEIVSVDFPVQIRKKGGAPVFGQLRVILRQYLDGEQSHELFIRQDLGIDGEKRLKSSRRIQPVLSLTFIDDHELSAFLTTAEEPTHRTWNSKRQKVLSLYDGTGPLLNSVRNAALRLVELLTPAGVRDSTALAQYFSDPQSLEITQSGAKGENKESQKGEKKTVVIIPPPKPKPIEFQSQISGFIIKGVPSEMATRNLPIQCEVRTAYATTFGDAFKQWDPAEFWLNDDSEFSIQGTNVSEIFRDGNELHFNLDQPNSVFKISGFDPNRKLEVQINYRESDHAEDLENN